MLMLQKQIIRIRKCCNWGMSIVEWRNKLQKESTRSLW